MTMIHEGESRNQVSGSTCRMTAVLSEQATHARRLTLTPAPCGAKESPTDVVLFQTESKSGPSGPGVHGPADDADLSRRIPIRPAPHGDRLDLAHVGRRPFEIFPGDGHIRIHTPAVPPHLGGSSELSTSSRSNTGFGEMNRR